MTWKVGDQVRHRLKPEWGAGRVLSAQSITHEGRPAQRLTIAFDRAGQKTLSTAFAQLEPADPSSVHRPSPAAEHEGDPVGGPFSNDTQAELAKKLLELPEPATDPFASRRKRLEATLGLYRFSDHGAPLLDWAAMQTGLKDPLSRFSRHELEEGFRRFQQALDQHLRKLVSECRRLEPATIQTVAAAADANAKQAMRRADSGR